jgi:hypothetical protein
VRVSIGARGSTGQVEDAGARYQLVVDDSDPNTLFVNVGISFFDQLNK